MRSSVRTRSSGASKSARSVRAETSSIWGRRHAAGRRCCPRKCARKIFWIDCARFESMKSVRVECFRAAVVLLAVGLSFSFANAATNQILTGQVLAGITPIKGATVTLYGTVYVCVPDPCSSVSKPVEETTTDAEGRFSFDLSKAHTKVKKMDVPGSQDNLTGRELPEKEQAPQEGSLFVVASGGDVGGGDNPAIKLVAAR